MILRNRVIWSDNGTIKDLSENLNNHISGTHVINYVAGQDYIYFGSDAPFNHRWIEISVANVVPSVLTVELWDGSAWKAVAETIDQTRNAVGDTSLSLSGRIIWVPDKQKTSWSADDTADHSGSVITGLGSVKIYDMFWARLSWSVSWTGTAALAFIGYKFANDEDLYSYYPEFNQTEAKNRFKPLMTTWDQVHFESAKEVIREMKSNRTIDFEGQILEWEALRIPAIHKAAEIAYSGYGSDWKDEKEQARIRFKDAMKLEIWNVDQNGNAQIDSREKAFRTGNLIR